MATAPIHPRRTPVRAPLPPPPAKKPGNREIQKIAIGRLPAALSEEIRNLRTQEASSQSPWGRVKFFTFLAIGSIGAIATLLTTFSQTLVPWIYTVSIITMAIGGIGAKQVYTSRVERQQQIQELESCNKDLKAGWRSPFQRHLREGRRRQFSIPELLELYRLFKASQKALQQTK